MTHAAPTNDVAHSCLFNGTIRHRRFTPVLNRFKYQMFMWYIDLDEVDTLAQTLWFFRKGRFGIASFNRADYVGDSEKDLKTEVLKAVQAFYENNGRALPDISSVRMLTHIRYFGLVINPVSFYYCFDAQNNLKAIVAEITNTPWGEKHRYILPSENEIKSADKSQAVNSEKYTTNDASTLTSTKLRSGTVRFDFEKSFHVSPFNPMQMDYRWVFKTPSEKLAVHMDNIIHAGHSSDTAAGDAPEKHFDATLNMTQEPLDKALGLLLKQPVVTVKVALGIYWQALKLWLKRSPFYDHPKLEDA